MKVNNLTAEEQVEIGEVLTGEKYPLANIPIKERKLHVRSLQSLTNEVYNMSLKGGRTKSVRNRIARLEKVIKFKTELFEEAMKQNERTSRTSENT
jgi:hypothetical protein